jgi:hypothetical protein
VVAIGAVLAGVWAVGQLACPHSDLTLAPVPAGPEAQAFARKSFLDTRDFDVKTLERFEPYGNLQSWVATAASGERCLVVDADDYGVVGVSCTPGDLAPIVDVRIWRGMRRDVFGDLPTGSVLRFEYDDGRVHVWVREPATPAPG